MTNRILHTLLVLTFALLQCVAPLVHAHVDGQHSGVLPPSLESHHHSQEQAECVVEADESPAIGLHEYQRNDQPVLAHSATAITFNIHPVVVVKLSPQSPPPAIVLAPYSKSHPQAPPALG